MGIASLVNASTIEQREMIVGRRGEKSPAVADLDVDLRLRVGEIREVAPRHLLDERIDLVVRQLLLGRRKRRERSRAQADQPDRGARRQMADRPAEWPVGVVVGRRHVAHLGIEPLRPVHGHAVQEDALGRAFGNAGHAEEAAPLIDDRIDEVQTGDQERTRERRRDRERSALAGEQDAEHEDRHRHELPAKEIGPARGRAMRRACAQDRDRRDAHRGHHRDHGRSREQLAKTRRERKTRVVAWRREQ